MKHLKLFENFSKSKIEIDFNSDKIYKDIIADNQKVGELCFASNRAGVIVLHEIKIDPKFRGLGYGKEAMRQLCEYADDKKRIISLTPSSDYGSNKNRLISFYKDFNFIMNKGKNIDFTISELMYRVPR